MSITVSLNSFPEPADKHNQKLIEILPKYDDLRSYLRANTPNGMLPTLHRAETKYEYKYHESGRINILETRLTHTGYIDDGGIIRITIDTPITAFITTFSYFANGDKLCALLDMIVLDSSLDELFIENGLLRNKKSLFRFCMDECAIRSMCTVVPVMGFEIKEILTWTDTDRVGDHTLEFIRVAKLALYQIDLGYRIKDEDFVTGKSTTGVYQKLVTYIKDYYGTMHEMEYVLK